MGHFQRHDASKSNKLPQLINRHSIDTMSQQDSHFPVSIKFQDFTRCGPHSITNTNTNMSFLSDNDDVCNDLMCTQKLTGSQRSLAHSANVKNDMPEKNEKQL